MKIYTSYYRKVSDDLRGMTPVSISTSTPYWFPWAIENLRMLVPGWDLVNGIKSGSITQEEYVERYKQKLSELDKAEVLHKLQQISQDNHDKDIVLLCYEKPGDFCHRHLVAEWLDCDVTELEA